jgi:hypothetical protein
MAALTHRSLTLPQYSLSFTFDSDGAVNTVYALERTWQQTNGGGFYVCLQFMKFDLQSVGHELNYRSDEFGVPMIMNPMIFDQEDCTLGQGPKDKAAAPPAMSPWAVALTTAAAVVATGAGVDA